MGTPRLYWSERRVPIEVLHKVMPYSGPTAWAKDAAEIGLLAHRIANDEADPCCEELVGAS